MVPVLHPLALAIPLLSLVGVAPAEPVPLAPPQDLAASWVDGGVQLTWSPPAEAVDAVYNVYRDGALLASSVEAQSFLDAPAAPGAVYAVTAVYAEGEGLPATTALFDCIWVGVGVPPVAVDPAHCIPG